MRVTYQHMNVHSGNESTLLRFTTEDGTRVCVFSSMLATVSTSNPCSATTSI